MKQKNKKLHFNKNVITELNDTRLNTIKGGTSAVITSTVSIQLTTQTQTNSRYTTPLCNGVSIYVPNTLGETP